MHKELVSLKISLISSTGLRHITILKLLGVGEDIGGVLELYPINGKWLFPVSSLLLMKSIMQYCGVFFAVISLEGWIWLNYIFLSIA